MKRCSNKDCPLYGQKEVPYSGNKKAKTVWIGESPGHEEVEAGRPFVGDSGKLARKGCVNAGLNWSSILIMNSARCRINKNELAVKEITQILKCCRPKVEAALRLVKPRVIVATGDFALRQILRKSGITKARGKWVWSKEFDCWVLPIFHPAYILRNMALKPLFFSDLEFLVEFVKNKYQPPSVEEDVHYSEGLLPLKDGHAYGVDTETQGLDWTDPNHLCISFSVSDRKGYGSNVRLFEECSEEDADFFIVWDRVSHGSKNSEPVDVWVRRSEGFDTKMVVLRRFLEDPNIKLYMMNGNFDVHVFRRLFNEHWSGYDLQIQGYAMDVQAAANILEENIYKMASLDFLQQSFTDMRHDYNAEFIKTYNKADMLSVPNEALVVYAASDADTTRRVAVRLKKELLAEPSLGRYFVQFTMPTLQALAMMEEYGAMIDEDALPAVKDDVHGLMLNAQKEAWKVAPKKVKDAHKKKGLKLTRDGFVRDVLFDEDGFGMKPVKMGKSKVPSIDKNTRTELLERRIPKNAQTFLHRYSEWSEYHTLFTRYLNGFEKWIKNDGRIHTSLSLTTAVNGRVASSSPNLQNVPKRSKSAKRIRQLIVALPKHLLLAADASQAELRWMAHVANEPEMIRIFKDTARDIHTETAKSLSVTAWDILTESDIAVARRNAKAVNFGLLYGMRVYGFMRYAKTEYGLDLTQEQAENWIEIFFSKYGGVRTYHKVAVEECLRLGHVESPLGRRRRLPEIYSKDRMLRGNAERMAINHKISSPSSDTVLIANNELHRKKLLNPDECRAILFIHDELVFEVKDNSKVQDYAKVIKHEMENPPLEKKFGVKLRVPLAAEVKVGRNLADLEELEV